MKQTWTIVAITVNIITLVIVMSIIIKYTMSSNHYYKFTSMTTQCAEGEKPVAIGWLLIGLISGLGVGVSFWFASPSDGPIWRFGGVMLSIVVVAYGVVGYVYNR